MTSQPVTEVGDHRDQTEPGEQAAGHHDGRDPVPQDVAYPDERGRGLDAREYVGEITDIEQPITHGGLSLKNLRNRAAMEGAFSLLLENRLDPSIGS